MEQPGFSEFTELAAHGNVIPVYTSFLADLQTPVSAFLRLQAMSDQAFLLESVEGGEKTARYSFLGCAPFKTIEFADGLITERENGETRSFRGNIFDHLAESFAGYKSVGPPHLPRFTGGAVGFFGYETVGLLEKLPPPKGRNVPLPDALFMLFDTILVFDHLTHQIYIINNVFLDPAADLRSQYDRACARVRAVKEQIRRDVATEVRTASAPAPIVSNFEFDQFCRAVTTAKSYIEHGDIFQVVLSQQFQKEIQVDPFQIYRALRVINPSPYLYYLKFGGSAIIGSSPELLVRVEDRTVEVRPIAGTRRRGRDATEDQQLMDELRHDEKEIAEHIMLVDLGRNDVGRVSRYGTVEVTELMVIERYSHVMHLVSNVRGGLKPELSALDALKACFPAGTVSGAPKIRAMEIIHELEPSARGVYAGALGYLDFSGNLDTCIAIRTIVTHGNRAYFQAGAGIVADSRPEREYYETLEKASALRSAIEYAERGLE